MGDMAELKKNDRHSEEEYDEHVGSCSKYPGSDEGEGSDSGPVDAMVGVMERLAFEPRTSSLRPKQWDLQRLVDYMKSKENLKVVTMAGAGISTAAGIPDFRSPNGLYSNALIKSLKISSPESLFSIEYFLSNPESFYKVAVNMLPKNAKPTITHYFLKLLNQKGVLKKHLTQNVDCLEDQTGIDEEKIIHVHGTMFPAVCLRCRALFTETWMRERITSKKVQVPRCCCGGLVKPGIVLYGDAISDEVDHEVNELFSDCNLVIVMGTSLRVTPFCNFISLVPPGIPRVLINRESAGFVKGKLPNLQFDRLTDIAILGDCDTEITNLCKELGWEKELTDIMNSCMAEVGDTPSVSSSKRERRNT